jgi:hypothetical protein
VRREDPGERRSGPAGTIFFFSRQIKGKKRKQLNSDTKCSFVSLSAFVTKTKSKDKK